MVAGIGAGGIVGIALETTPGTYLAPTKYVPINSETFEYQQETIWRRAIRQSADFTAGVPGNVHVEGDVNAEVLEDTLLYFLYCMRSTVVKTGTTPNFTYTFTPSSAALPPNKTMSVTIVRNSVVFGYTGCVVSSFRLMVEAGILNFQVSMLGRDEAVQSAPTPTWPATPNFGAGTYQIQIPTSTQVFDAESFDLQIDDGGVPEFRLKDTGRGAQFIRFGERAVTLQMERDFETRAEYDAFKALTAQSITLLSTRATNRSVKAILPAAIKDSYSIGMSGQGDLIKASMTYNGTVFGVSSGYTLEVKTSEDIT